MNNKLRFYTFPKTSTFQPLRKYIENHTHNGHDITGRGNCSEPEWTRIISKEEILQSTSREPLFLQYDVDTTDLSYPKKNNKIFIFLLHNLGEGNSKNQLGNVN